MLAEAAGWGWLDMAAIISDARGNAKSADALLDSAHGNFVARTHALPGEYAHMADEELRERIVRSAQKLASGRAIIPTDLTLGRAETANGIISCIAQATYIETTSACASRAKGSPARSSRQ